LLLLSPSEIEFWRHFRNAFGKGIQIDIFDRDSEAV